MKRVARAAAAATAVVVGAALLGSAGQAAASTGAGAAQATPRWVRHVQTYPGGISAGVRARLDPAAVAAAAGAAPRALVQPALTSGRNVQMNDDSDPPLPQNETAVAASLDDPAVAVAAANDYVSGGVAVMRTSDGGAHWATTRVVPVFQGTNDACSGGDPAVSYSRRDHVFYLSQLCFFRTLAYSEVQVFVSGDDGRTWTGGRTAARAASNFDYAKRTVDESVFNDKEYIAVDNTPTSPHYGRLYVTYTKFHVLPSGFSDYCPLQLSYTDTVNRLNPALTTFAHTPISPDAPGAKGVGSSANQFSVPVVEPDGTLDVGFVNEECNTSYDPHLLFQTSTDGGATFLPHAVQIDKPGQYADFKDAARDDTLPPTKVRVPNTISMVEQGGVLTYVYQNNVQRRRTQADISYQQSTDGGRHWSDARFLTRAPNDQFFPWIAAGGKGQLFAIWFDRRRDPRNVDIDTWEAVSNDDGASWSERRISTAAWNPNRGFFSSGAFIGDYNGLAVSATHVYPVWTDGRNSAIARTGIGETDVFTDVERR